MISQEKIRAGIVIFLAVLLCMPPAALAGNLQPSAPPTTGTMHTLDDIYNQSNNSATLPNPEQVTIITKTGGNQANTFTLYTVTPGKTFYLMGLNAPNGMVLSLFDGTTDKQFFYLGNNGMSNIVSSYPIAVVPSGTEIRACCAGYINIWGYEK